MVICAQLGVSPPHNCFHSHRAATSGSDTQDSIWGFPRDFLSKPVKVGHYVQPRHSYCTPCLPSRLSAIGQWVHFPRLSDWRRNYFPWSAFSLLGWRNPYKPVSQYSICHTCEGWCSILIITKSGLANIEQSSTCETCALSWSHHPENLGWTWG